MSAIDEIIGHINDALFSRLVIEQTDIRDLIAAALADARREGAEQMREALPEALRQKFIHLPRYSFHLHNGGVRRVQDSCGNWVEHHAAHELFDPERSSALPLPTGPRQAVRLTRTEIAEALLGQLPAHLRGNDAMRDIQARPGLIEMGRAIESAVLAANGMGDGND